MELKIKAEPSLMYGYDLVFFMMHLVSDISQTDDISESEPILSQPTISLSEIKQENSNADCQADELSTLINTEQPQCRICLDNEGEDLIAPCYCRGTQKYVHRSCLDNWRSTKEGFAFSHCTECRATFLLRANVPPDRWWTRLKFQMLVVRDHVLIFIVVQLVVVLLSMIVYRFYGEELREMFGYEQHPYAFYSLGVLAIVLVGLLYGFFVAIICGQRINDRHYHVLAKQELTKVQKAADQIQPTKKASQKSRSNKEEEAKKNSSGINQGLKTVRKISETTENMSQSLLNGVLSMSGFVSAPLVNSQAGKAFFGMLPGEVLLASLAAVSTVLEAVEVAERKALAATSGVVSGAVSKRFGESAGEATEDVFATAGHAVGTAWNVVKLRKALNPSASLKSAVLHNALKKN